MEPLIREIQVKAGQVRSDSPPVCHEALASYHQAPAQVSVLETPFVVQLQGRKPRTGTTGRYLAQASKTRAWGLPRACALWSLSFPREGPVSAMFIGFGHLRPHTEHHPAAAGRQLSVSPKAERSSHHLRQIARRCTAIANTFVIAALYRGHSRG